MNGAKIILETLHQNGVECVFGYPGGAALPLYDEVFKQNKIKHYLTCHEQAAVHAAQGYARSTGKIGVVFVTSGPGATNTITGIADAMLDSTPLLVITSQVPTFAIGTDAFQEADIFGITRPITKYNYLIDDINKLEKILSEALYIAQTGRKGPVVIDVPKNIHTMEIDSLFVNKADGVYSHSDMDTRIDDIRDLDSVRKSYILPGKPSEDLINKVVDLILSAKKPIFYCGGGLINSGTEGQGILFELSTNLNIPVTLTLMGLGGFPATHKNFIGMLGMHGNYEANMAMYEADLIIAIGARFDDRVIGKIEKFSPNSKKIHIDIDCSEINKNIKIDIGVNADAGVALSMIQAAVKLKQKDTTDLSPWWNVIQEWRSKKCLSYDQSTSSTILPQFAIDSVIKESKKYDSYITTDVGQHQMWAAQYANMDEPNRFITSGGLGTMGFGFPAAIGAQIAYPNSKSICITGDASILMNIQELGTLKKYKIPVKIIIINNSYLGMVRQWQESFYENRHSESDFTDILPNFVKLADAFDIKAKTVDKVEDLESAIREVLESNEAFILNICVKRDENVYPMIAPGAAHNDMILNNKL